MRFIDLEQLKPRVRDLLPALAEAQRAVMQETDPARRAQLITRYRNRWTAFREVFSEFSHGKCWYVECRNSGTDDDIDHFRPKLAVKEDLDHPGYYWLAFEWTNLRLSCHRANRPRINQCSGETGGKAEHFPLVHPEDRASGPEDDLSKELPALLDPTNFADPTLLTFRPDGEVSLSPLYASDPVAELRFDKSRLWLHLNWPEFRDARLTLFNKIERTVDRGARQAPFGHAGVHSATEGFWDVLRDLRNFMDPREEYSMAARAYVESFGHVWWIRDIVLKV